MVRVVKSSSRAPSVVERKGSITRLPSGSLRVKVYAGPHPVTGRPHYIGETIADVPLAREQAEEACRRLLGQVRCGRRLHSHATVNDLLDRHLAMAHVGERTRASHLLMASKHLRPFIGHLPLRAVTAEKLEHLYAELLRCREHYPPRPEPGHRVPAAACEHRSEAALPAQCGVPSSGAVGLDRPQPRQRRGSTTAAAPGTATTVSAGSGTDPG
jgi:hypothetical protein